MTNIFAKTSIQSTGKWGTFLALACAVHCIAMPFVSTALPLVGLQFLESELFEIALVSIGLSFGAYSVFKGYWSIHRKASIPMLFAAGTCLLLSGILFAPEELEIVLVVAGAVLVGIAQYQNRRISHSCDNPHHVH